MTLSDQIDELRQRMMDEHAREMATVQELDEFLEERDVALIRALQAVLNDEERRRQDIVIVLQKLATRIGAAPPLTVPPLPGVGMPRVVRPPEASHHMQAPPLPPKPAATRARHVV